MGQPGQPPMGQPGQPPMGQHPQAAYGQAPGQYNPQPMGAGPGGPPQWNQQQPAPKRPNRTIWYIVGAVVLVIALVLAWVFTRDGGDPEGTASSASASPTVADTPEAVVEQYFAALTTGDLETLKLISVDGGEQLEGLTSEAIAAAAAAGPVQNLELNSYSGSSSVDATYTINGTSATTYLTLSNTGGGWKLKELTSEITGLENLPKGVTATLNGVEMESPALTPGVWELGTTNEFVVYTPETILVDQVGYVSTSVEASLTKDGVKSIRSAIKSAVAKCEKDPYGCGVELPENVIGGGKVDKESMTCELDSSSDSVSDIEIKLSYSGDLDIYAYLYYDCVGKDTKGNSIKGSGSITDITVDFSNPEKIKVTIN